MQYQITPFLYVKKKQQKNNFVFNLGELLVSCFRRDFSNLIKHEKARTYFVTYFICPLTNSLFFGLKNLQNRISLHNKDKHS